jgi:hypothetical protein
MNRAIVWLFVLEASFAMASPKSTRLSMKHTEGTNLHIANQGGAIHWQADIAITVELRDDQKLEVVSAGKRGEHNLYPGPTSRSTEDDTVWTARWNGTWSQTGDKLQLDLVLVDDKCKHTKATTELDTARGLWVNYAPEILSCKVASKQTQLACTSELLEIDDPTQPRVAAWRCNAVVGADVAESPGQWVFGKTICIETLAGHMTSTSYRKCAP